MENSLVTEAGLLNEELLEDEVEVVGRGCAPTVASAYVAAETISTAAETANLASDLQADLGINSVSIVEQDCYRVLVSLFSWPGQLLSLNPCWRPKILARMLFGGILSLTVVILEITAFLIIDKLILMWLM